MARPGGIRYAPGAGIISRFIAVGISTLSPSGSCARTAAFGAAGCENMMYHPNIVTEKSYTICWRSFISTYVCTSGAQLCWQANGKPHQHRGLIHKRSGITHCKCPLRIKSYVKPRIEGKPQRRRGLIPQVADADTANVLTLDEARRIASNMTKLPELLSARAWHHA
jgi:hypothetical protein